MAKQGTKNEESSHKVVQGAAKQKEGDLGLVRRQEKFTDSTAIGYQIEGHLCDKFHHAHNTRPPIGPHRPIKK